VVGVGPIDRPVGEELERQEGGRRDRGIEVVWFLSVNRHCLELRGGGKRLIGKKKVQGKVELCLVKAVKREGLTPL